jgi:hypothetical protein
VMGGARPPLRAAGTLTWLKWQCLQPLPQQCPRRTPAN